MSMKLQRTGAVIWAGLFLVLSACAPTTPPPPSAPATSANGTHSKPVAAPAAGSASGTTTSTTSSSAPVSPSAPKPPTPGRFDPSKTLVYEGNLIDLAELIGASHYVRTLCYGRDDQTWRLNMQSLLEREAKPNSPLYDELVDAFNVGFKSLRKSITGCDANAKSMAIKLAERGKAISNLLAGGYQGY